MPPPNHSASISMTETITMAAGRERLFISHYTAKAVLFGIPALPLSIFKIARTVERSSMSAPAWPAHAAPSACPSFIATVMSPFTFSVPIMKAMRGLSLPASRETKS